MQYIKPYTYFVEKKGGTNNLLMGSLCLLSTQIIPLVGQIVLLGYQAEMADDLKNDPDIENYVDFSFDRFSKYLSRGVWVFVMQLIVGAVTALLALLSAGVGGLIYLALQDQTGMLVGIGVGVILMMLTSLFSLMLTLPLSLHVQLSHGFYFGSAVRFATSFLKKMSGQLMLVIIVHMFFSSLLTIAGMMLFCIGIFPAVTIASMAQEHFMIQLYRVYLDEGGDPIGSDLEELEFDEE